MWLRSEGFRLETVTAAETAGASAAASGGDSSIGLSYWVKDAATVTNDNAESDPASLAQQQQQESQHTPPVAVFAHGMGIGLLPYCFYVLPELRRLQACNKVGAVVLIRQPHIAMDPIASESARYHPNTLNLRRATRPTSDHPTPPLRSLVCGMTYMRASCPLSTSPSVNNDDVVHCDLQGCRQRRAAHTSAERSVWRDCGSSWRHCDECD